MSEEHLRKNETALVSVKRGGDFTAHEPGQMVIYAHIDLKKREFPLAEFLQFFITTAQKSILETWNLAVSSRKNAPGLYLDDGSEKKIVSIGIFTKSFFTSYGIAVNLRNSLQAFQFINPCGIASNRVQSIQSIGLDPNKGQEFQKNFREIWRNEPKLN